MFAQVCDYAKNHWNVHLKCVNYMIFKLYLNKAVKKWNDFYNIRSSLHGKGANSHPNCVLYLHDPLTAWPFLGSAAASLTIHPRAWDPFALCRGTVLSLTVDLFLKTSLVSLGSKLRAFQENIQLVDSNWSKQTQKDEQSLWFACPPNEVHFEHRF